MIPLESIQVRLVKHRLNLNDILETSPCDFDLHHLLDRPAELLRPPVHEGRGEGHLSAGGLRQGLNLFPDSSWGPSRRYWSALCWLSINFITLRRLCIMLYSQKTLQIRSVHLISKTSSLNFTSLHKHKHYFCSKIWNSDIFWSVFGTCQRRLNGIFLTTYTTPPTAHISDI